MNQLAFKTGRRSLTVSILFGVVAIAFESFAVLTAMPAAAKELGRLDLYAWAFTSFVVAMLFATVLGGRLVDRMGPGRPLGWGLLIFVLGLVAAGFATTMGWLLAMRVVQGLGGGFITVALMVLVAQAYEESERPRVMTYFSVCWVVPSFFGPPLSAWIAENLGWPWVFWATIPLLAIAVALGIGPTTRLGRRQGEPRQVRSEVPIWAAAVTSLGVALLQVAGQRLEPEATSNMVEEWALTIGIALASLVLLAVAVLRLMPHGFARFGRGLPAVVIQRGCQAGAFFAAEAFLPLLLRELHGFSLVQAGSVLTIGSIGWALGSWLQSRPWLLLRRDQIIQVGSLMAIVGAASLVVGAGLPGIHWIWIGIGNSIAGFGMGLAVASTSLAVFTLSQTEELGRNTSSLQVADSLGNSLATAAAGTVFVLLHPGGDVHLTYGLLIGVSVLAALLAFAAAGRIGPVQNDSAAGR